MVNKKTNRYYRRAYQAIYKRPTIPQDKKTKRERRKYLQPKKYEVFKKKEATRARERQTKKDVKAIIGQHWNVNLRNNINHVFSILNKSNFEPNCSQDWKITPIQSSKEGRGYWNSSQKVQSAYSCTWQVRKKKEWILSEEKEKRMNFLERSDITYTTPRRRDTVYVGMDGGRKEVFAKTILTLETSWLIRNY